MSATHDAQTRWNSTFENHPMRYVDPPLSPWTSRVLSSAGLSWASLAPPETEISHWALGRRVLPGRGDAKGSNSARFCFRSILFERVGSRELSPKPVPDPMGSIGRLGLLFPAPWASSLAATALRQ
ncbi:hypothetical protein PaG_04409 [Moesziomyces aphidis]|uniref:Uncharacterized protein n=1 Tax=Moesziomyces aphidis TaxID=84754 RepID=W3VKP9_MOEAP|nr:hypothetical protein PaG_04409 [Moesziomyces aphidis]